MERFPGCSLIAVAFSSPTAVVRFCCSDSDNPVYKDFQR